MTIDQIKPIVPVINWNNPITKGLVFDLPFFEGGGSSTADIARRTTGVFTNSPTWSKFPFGPCINFTGGASTQYVLITNPPLFTNTVFNYFSCMVFFQKTGTLNASGSRIFEFNSTSSPNNRLRLQSADDNLIRFIISNGADNTTVESSAFTTGVVYMATCTYDGTNASLYINGLPAATPSTAVSGVLGLNTANNIYIGNGNGTTANRAWNGNISDLIFWNRALNAQEVNQLYTNPWQIYRRTNLSLFNFGLQT